MKKEFDIDDEWLSFEIHPETPPEGVLLTEHLSHIDWDEMYTGLRKSGKEYNIEFGGVTILANSRKAFEASEFAREQGKYDELHEGLFYAYFTEVRNIGDEDVIMDVASKEGLDTSALKQALDAEIEKRKTGWKAPEPKIKTGYAYRYSQMVTSASTGAVFKY